MVDQNFVQKYWENKILSWEKFRYSRLLFFYPVSWSIRARLFQSIKILRMRKQSDWRVCELGCGSGILAKKIGVEFKEYLGIDIASNAIELAKRRNKDSDKHHKIHFQALDITSFDFKFYDLYIFLGLTDWLDLRELENLFSKINTNNMLFSYTEEKILSPWNPYRIYRSFIDRNTSKFSYVGHAYSQEQIKEILNRNGFKMEIVHRASLVNPGVLVWASK